MSKEFSTGKTLLQKKLKSHSNLLESFFKISRKLIRTLLIFINSGVPAVVDLASMRDAMKRLGGDAKKINPISPVDLVIDHSV